MVKAKAKGCNKVFSKGEPCWWWGYWDAKREYFKVECYLELHCGTDNELYCLDCAEKIGIQW